jgi:hypothetical protein
MGGYDASESPSKGLKTSIRKSVNQQLLPIGEKKIRTNRQKQFGESYQNDIIVINTSLMDLYDN